MGVQNFEFSMRFGLLALYGRSEFWGYAVFEILRDNHSMRFNLTGGCFDFQGFRAFIFPSISLSI